MRQKFCSHVKATPLFYVIEAFHDFIPILETWGDVSVGGGESHAPVCPFRKSVCVSSCSDLRGSRLAVQDNWAPWWRAQPCGRPL